MLLIIVLTYEINKKISRYISLIEIFPTHINLFHRFKDVHICTYIQGFYIHIMNIA